ncbi:MAG: prephenate dehydrogenase/arogenate dehydrogenase family protein [Methylacidiphilales bacterium]|nr:prephenate dehydrogenase/arogenate dehydrogenase family protein [Candidatus Methylacidiphilales bacterium]
MKFRNIIICGGATGIGYWFGNFLRKQLLASQSELFLYDLDRSIELNKSSLASVFNDNVLSPSHFTITIEPTDLLVIAVPVNQVEELCKTLLNIHGSTEKALPCHVVNLCSVQRVSKQSILALLQPLTYLGIHLLFGPEINTYQNNTIVLVNDEDTPHHAQSWSDNFKQQGFTIIQTNADDHDRTMHHVQVAIHFLYFGLAEYLKDQKVSIQWITPFLTPIARAYLSSVAHTLLQTKQTYANIQAQQGAQQTREQVLASLHTCAQAISQPTDAMVTYLEQLSDYFPREDLLKLQKLFKQ